MSARRGSRRAVARSGAPRLPAFAVGLMLWLGMTGATSALVWAGSSATAQRPKGFPEQRTPKNNPTTIAKASVGRRLFYDRRLSGNQTQSCGSCHRQDLAFTDGRAQAVGSTGQIHPRSAQSLVNVGYYATLTWANPALVTLERQMEVPLFGTNPVEMGVTDRNKQAILARIRRDAWYRQAFRRAFPNVSDPIRWTTIIRAIASFQRSLVSANSRYDRYERGEGTLTASEKRGLGIFVGEKGECAHCHGTFLFSDQATYRGAPAETPQFHNTGLYNLGGTGAFPAGNQGVYSVSGRAEDMGRFRAPTLRNIALTAPYMHDGSIKTLQEAVDHYARGGRLITEGPFAGDGRTSPFKDPLVSGIDLNARDKADLIAFLRSLTDRSIASNPRFSDPFRVDP